ncbi:MAG TPA: S8 family serine peptidase [Pilimelia sp.]|nr:S8 family serine peptidase [Pilimelia sp.]
MSKLTRMVGLAVLCAGGTAVVPAAPAAAGPLDAGSAVQASVIVGYDDAVGAAPAERAVTRAGGTVSRRLDAVDAFAARVPQRAVAAVRAAAGVRAVTPDAPVRLKAGEWTADQDRNSLYSITKSAGVHDVWARSAATGKKITGAGVGVALIDSGVAPVKGLTGTGKVVNGPDLSFESQVPNLRYLDTFGHGTHLAGIIAGRDPEVVAGQESTFRSFVGVAPGAHVVNVKVAAADGATDVSQVIAAIDWVVQHRNDPGMNIRVLNLSFGTDSTQDARLDPLSYAVEAAWRKGIVVVVAVGNDGAAKTKVSMPAANPFVIAVGAVDSQQTEDRADDMLATFSTRGNAARHADVLAAGRSIVSLRNPGGFVDRNYPASVVGNETTQRYARGSGTSQAAAVVSGAAALLLQHRPTLTPDQVKRLLVSTAWNVSKSSSLTYGAGQIDVKMAVEAPTPTVAVQSGLAGTGLGSLELSRGTAHVADTVTGIELTGEKDIFGRTWVPSGWAPKASLGTAWTGGTWNGNAWAGEGWTGTSWSARTWSARTWSARTWSGGTWSARTWSDATWSSSGWSARTWSARTWSARTWSGNYWAAKTWK